MKWPRGKHNGQRIVGFRLDFRLNVRRWWFLLPNRYSWKIVVGPLWLGFDPEYEPHEPGF